MCSRQIIMLFFAKKNLFLICIISKTVSSAVDVALCDHFVFIHYLNDHSNRQFYLQFDYDYDQQLINTKISLIEVLKKDTIKWLTLGFHYWQIDGCYQGSFLLLNGGRCRQVVTFWRLSLTYVLTVNYLIKISYTWLLK